MFPTTDTVEKTRDKCMEERLNAEQTDADAARHHD
jgi:hypothetical protein